MLFLNFGQTNVWELLLLIVTDSTGKVLSTRVFLDWEEPVSQGPNQVHGVHSTDVVHGSGGNWHVGWEREEAHGENGPCNSHDVGEQTQLSEPETSMLDVVSASVKKTAGWHHVTQQKEGDTANHHRVEGGGGSQVQAAQNGNNQGREQVGVQWNSQVRVNNGEVLGEWQTVVSAERPAQSSLPCVGGDGTTSTGKQHQGTQTKRTGFALKSLVEDVENRHSSTVVDDSVQVSDTEKHGDGVGQCSGQTDGHGSQNGDWDDSISLMDLLSQVGGRVETGETPVGVDQTNNECNTGALPASVVLEVHEHEVGRVVVASGADQHSDQNDGV